VTEIAGTISEPPQAAPKGEAQGDSHPANAGPGTMWSVRSAVTTA